MNKQEDSRRENRKNKPENKTPQKNKTKNNKSRMLNSSGPSPPTMVLPHPLLVLPVVEGLPDLVSFASDGPRRLMSRTHEEEDEQLADLLSELVSWNHARIIADKECEEVKRINWMRHGDYFSDEFLEAFGEVGCEALSSL